MAVSIPRTGTEDTRNALTIKVGTVADITSVGMYFTLDPAGSGSAPPMVTDFTTVTLAKPGDPLHDGLSQLPEMVALIGDKSGDFILAPGDWQRWVLIQTDRENIIRPVDVTTIT